MADPKPILDMIAKHEAGPGAVRQQGVATDYDVVWGRIPREHRPQALLGAPLTRLTIGQVLHWQRDVVARGSPSSAAGRYQFIRATLEGTRLLEGVALDARFDEATQDRLAVRLLIGRGWSQVVTNRMSVEDFADALAREWASLPVQSDQKGAHRNVERGQSFYAGDNLNRASASPEEVIAAIRVALAAPGAEPGPVQPPAAGDRAEIEALRAQLAEQGERLARLEAFVKAVGAAAAL